MSDITLLILALSWDILKGVLNFWSHNSVYELKLSAMTR